MHAWSRAWLRAWLRASSDATLDWDPMRSAILATVLLGLVGEPFSAQAAAQELGQPAPPISAETWTGWIGDGPSLDALRGRTVLVHFFVTEKPRRAAWLTLLLFHHEYADKGLVILAVTADSSKQVEKMLTDFPLPFAVGAGSDMREDWGVRGKYAQFLVSPDGTLYFRADSPNGIWNGKLLKALKGAKRLKERAPARVVPSGEFGRKARGAVDLLAEGRLGKALVALERTRDGASTTSEDRADAVRLIEATQEHLERVAGQIEASLDNREVLPATAALEFLAKDLKRHPFGAPFVNRLEELGREPEHLRETEAAEEYEKCVEAFFARGWQKNLARFEKLVERYPETRAAEKMYDFWIKRGW